MKAEALAKAEVGEGRRCTKAEALATAEALVTEVGEGGSAAIQSPLLKTVIRRDFS